MSETPFATAQDVEDRWRVLSSTEFTKADTLLADASDIIRDRWPDVDVRIETGTLRESSVVRIVAGMVKRAMMNTSTEGVESQSQNAGPFGVSNTFTNPNANLYLTADDIRLLGGPASRRAFAVDLSPDTLPVDYYYSRSRW